MPRRPDNDVDPTGPRRPDNAPPGKAPKSGASPFVPEGGRKNAPKKLAREEALGGVPERLPVESQEDMVGGGVRLKVRFSRARWQRWFGMPETALRTFELDAFGREVYESCDGRRDVKSVVRRFGESHKLSPAEAEISVTTFLKMLIAKGLIVVHVPAGRSGHRTDGGAAGSRGGKRGPKRSKKS